METKTPKTSKKVTPSEVSSTTKSETRGRKTNPNSERQKRLARFKEKIARGEKVSRGRPTGSGKKTA